jgi:sugar lactone lactonase YvrE
VDRDGGVLIVDLFGDRVRRVAPDGTIRTIAGGGRPGPPPLTAPNVDIPRPTGVAVAPDGSVYVMTLFGIMKIAPDQRVTSVNGSSDGAPNNGGPVATAGFKSDFGLNAMVSDSDGNIYVADSGHFQLRRIGTDGIVHAFAGSGLFRQAGENWPAVVSSFNSPTRLAVGSQGQIYFLERDNCKIREIQANGLVRTVAGNGSCGTRGGPNTPAERPSATDEGFGALSSITADADGNVYVHDGIRVVRVAPDGRMSAVINREARPLPVFEDGIPALNTSLNGYTGGIALDRAGNLYVADTSRHRVRKVSDGIISTVAGSGPVMGPGGFAGDGGPAVNALLDRPTDLVFDRSDNLFILDSANGRIRKVSPAGIITTIVNLGAPADSWTQLAIDAAGNIYVSDLRNHRVRRISTDGSLAIAAGTGEAGFSGDGGRPETARLTEPTGVAIDATGNVYVGDTGNHRIRRITAR